VTLCSFSPCIEQAQRTVACLRAHGWARAGMSELRQRFLVVRRERVGLHEEGLRGVNAAPADVDEAVARLRELERRSSNNGVGQEEEDDDEEEGASAWSHVKSRQARLAEIQEKFKTRKVYKEGRLVHRTEPDLKTHTSYLVFAVLPREWTDKDEAAVEAQMAASREQSKSEDGAMKED
jgi:tRNA (adenine57-N1/adenine58-N1)-methyltransferase